MTPVLKALAITCTALAITCTVLFTALIALFFWHRYTVNAMVVSVATLRADLATCKANTKTLEVSITEQNAAVTKFKADAMARLKASANELAKAEARAADKKRSAQLILLSPPLDADSCKSGVIRSQRWAEGRKL